MAAKDYISNHIMKAQWEGLDPINPRIQAFNPKGLPSAWGAHRFAGIGDVEKLFGKGLVTPAPFQHAGGMKALHDYEPEKVQELIRKAPEGLREVDPRYLLATQPSVTRPGVEYYMGDEYEKTGKTYADPGSAGNVYPVVYERETEGGIAPMLLSGHHRATAALLQGRPLKALVVRGGFGPPRDVRS